MEEIIKDACVNRKNITFFDLQDAFGAVPNALIEHTLELVQEYIRTHYRNTKSIVSTPNFTTQEFSFQRGILQGDQYSPIIFLLAIST